ncbi:Hypothetical protein NTJ_12182 [Nesidiocoris tenuis]|uniref:Uncharacterized protein n=1 Tax=Nesidiocoris tenuis TaxID=355587 RepID=A0ABN7B4M9_9HEMI|nr:Hypothetical protein NTJ_12182 [Nesidiocoris tenuis]
MGRETSYGQRAPASRPRHDFALEKIVILSKFSPRAGKFHRESSTRKMQGVGRPASPFYPHRPSVHFLPFKSGLPTDEGDKARTGDTGAPGGRELYQRLL